MKSLTVLMMDSESEEKLESQRVCWCCQPLCILPNRSWIKLSKVDLMVWVGLFMKSEWKKT